MKKRRKKNKYTLYQFNKDILRNNPPYDNDQLAAFRQELTTWDEKLQAQYYMLLNKEKRYYTLLHYDSADADNNNISNTLGDGIAILLCELGYYIISHENVSIDDHYEIWVKNDTETLVYLLFPFDKGVVNYG